MCDRCDVGFYGYPFCVGTYKAPELIGHQREQERVSFVFVFAHNHEILISRLVSVLLRMRVSGSWISDE